MALGSKEKRVGASVESGILTWRNAAGLLGVLAIMALAGGYLGALHPIGDSLAVGRAFAVIGVLLSAVLLNITGLQIASFAATLFAMICGMQVFLAYYLPGPPGRLLIYQKNMHFENLELEALAADIRAANPLGITLQEVSESNLALLEGLKDSYPHQQVCPWGSVGGVAVASRLPMIEGTGFCAPGLAAMQVKTEDNQFWLVSIHLHWPWPYQQRDHLKTLLPVLAKLEGPVILAGDFNMVEWAYAVKALADVTQTKAAGPTLGTYLGYQPWLRLPIDHVYAPSGGRVEARGAFGSDHLGLLAGVEL